MAGRFAASDEGLLLELEGGLPGTGGREVGFEEEMVRGESLQGRPLTLLNCQEARRGFGAPRRFPDALHVGRALLGVRLPQPSEAAFARSELRIRGLAEFVGRSGLSFEQPGAEGRPRWMRVDWEAADEIEASVEGASLKFRNDAGLEYTSDFEFSLRHAAWATVDAPKLLDLERWDRVFLDSVVSLVALGLNAPSGIEAWALARNSGRRASTGRTVEVLQRSRPTYGPREGAQRPFFALNDLGQDAIAAIEGFFGFRRSQPEAAELLFEYQIFSGALNPADRLLYMARFLEAFHRTKYGARDVFVDRLKALFRSEASPASSLFGATVDRLSEAVRDTRNYYTHYDPSLRARAVHTIELDDLADRLWSAVRSCVLGEMGLPPALRTNLLEREPGTDRLMATTI